MLQEADGVTAGRGHSPSNPSVRKSLYTSTAPVEEIPRVTFQA